MKVSFFIDSFVKKKIEYFLNKNNCNIRVLIGKYKNGFLHFVDNVYSKKLKDFFYQDPIKTHYIIENKKEDVYQVMDSIDLDLTEYNLKIQLFSKNNTNYNKNPYNLIFEGGTKIFIIFNSTCKYQDFEEALKTILAPLSKGKYLCSYQERKTVIENFNGLFGKVSKNPFIVFNKPYNLKRDNLDTLENYLIFPKLDGIRYFLYINFGIYLINSTEFLKIDNKINSSQNKTLIDGELINNIYYPFDVLFWNGEDIREKPRLKRLECISELNIENLGIEIINPETNLHDGYLKFKHMKNTDGIILSPNEASYHNSKTYKYKPDELQVIDFCVKKEGETGYGMYNLYVKDDKNNYVQFKGNDIYPFFGCTRLTDAERRLVDLNTDKNTNNVIEFKWKYDRFIPLRSRSDKTQANYINVALSIWDDINEPIPENEFLNKTKLKNLPEIIEINPMNNYSVKMLSPNETYTFFSPFYENLIRTGVLGDGSCFFHALFYSISKEYRKMSLSEKNKYIRNFRDSLSKTITIDDWLKMGEGSVALIAYQIRINKTFEKIYNYLFFDGDIDRDYIKIINNNLKIKNILGKKDKKYYLDVFLPDFFKKHPYVIESKNTIGGAKKQDEEFIIKNFMYDICIFSKELEYSLFIDYVNSNNWVDQRLIGYVCNKVDRDIYFIDGDTRAPYMLGGESDYKRRKSVVLCFTNNSHFESIGIIRNNKVSREFSKNDKLIEKLYTFLFKKDVFRKNYPELKMFLPFNFQ